MSHWLEHPVFLPLRIPLAGVYYTLVTMNNFAFDHRLRAIGKVGVPVISVGNLSVGGSGKTLVVEALARHLRASGIKAGILSRGYGRGSQELIVVSDGEGILTGVDRSGDEAFLLASLLPDCPVVVSAERFPGAVRLQDELGVDCILLDDGFQHRKLHRDLDIVLLDPSIRKKPHLLPWGYLREPPSALHRADQVIYSKGLPEHGLTDSAVLKFEYPEYVITADGSPIPMENLKGKRGAFAGLGNPGFFFDAVIHQVGLLAETLTFPDHCPYVEEDLDRIREKTVDCWITSAKDAVKLSREFRDLHNVYALPVKVQLPESTLRAVDKLLEL